MHIEAKYDAYLRVFQLLTRPVPLSELEDGEVYEFDTDEGEDESTLST